MCILIDVTRNKAVGNFPTLKEALKYAKEEGLKTVTWEFFKGEK